MSMPLAIVGSNFVRVWEDREVYKASEKLRSMMIHISPEAIAASFKEIDSDRSGNLSFEELKTVFDDLGLTLTIKEARKVWKALDQDSSGMISIAEFHEFVFPESTVGAAAIEKVKNTKSILRSVNALNAAGAGTLPPQEDFDKASQNKPSSKLEKGVLGIIGTLNGQETGSSMFTRRGISPEFLQASEKTVALTDLNQLVQLCRDRIQVIRTMMLQMTARGEHQDITVAPNTVDELQSMFEHAMQAKLQAEMAVNLFSRLQRIRRKAYEELPGVGALKQIEACPVFLSGLGSDRTVSIKSIVHPTSNIARGKVGLNS